MCAACEDNQVQRTCRRPKRQKVKAQIQRPCIASRNIFNRSPWKHVFKVCLAYFPPERWVVTLQQMLPTCISLPDFISKSLSPLTGRRGAPAALELPLSLLQAGLADPPAKSCSRVGFARGTFVATTSQFQLFTAIREPFATGFKVAFVGGRTAAVIKC